MKHVEAVVNALVYSGARMATKYVSKSEVVRATRRRYRGRIVKGASTVDIVMTLGRPNYDERKFIKTLIKAGEKFPVKKVLLKFPAKPR